MDIIAHRGNSQYFNDNTWESIISAHNVGADMCEVDLQETKDGKIIINHDYYLNKKRIIEIDFKDIKNVILLEDLLKWTKDVDWKLLLEVKEIKNVLTLKSVLKGYEDYVVIGGFNALFLKEFKEICNNIKTSLMIGSVISLDDIIFLAKKYGVNVVHPCWESRAAYPNMLISSDFVNNIHDNGLEIVLWHEEKTEELVKLLEYEPDGICTNDPELLKMLKN